MGSFVKAIGSLAVKHLQHLELDLAVPWVRDSDWTGLFETKALQKLVLRGVNVLDVPRIVRMLKPMHDERKQHPEMKWVVQIL